MYVQRISLTERESTRLLEFISADAELSDLLREFDLGDDDRTLTDLLTEFCHIARRESSKAPGQWPPLDRLAEATLNARLRINGFEDPVSAYDPSIAHDAMPTDALYEAHQHATELPRVGPGIAIFDSRQRSA